ncbi:transporter substrate-binding domain-containing protein [Nonomuraea sp. NPDC050404]|uniref:transporter substrate-binding domain-containing protein n=1 Tax=Nonomuraea sp. NPDC050404 TaxID=3155783 RepID=UPI0033FCB132
MLRRRRNPDRTARRIDAFVGTLVALFMLALLALGTFAAVQAVTRANTESIYDLLAEADLTGADMPVITIGVRDGLPGIAERRPDGTYKGFDVDVALAVAKYLKFPPEKVRFASIKIGRRVEMQGQEGSRFVPVDLVVAAFSITQPRKDEGVTFSEAYLYTRQAVMTLADYDGTLQSEGDLRGKKICTLTGSTAEPILVENEITYIGRHTLNDCIAELRNGKVTAVRSDAAILAGFIVRDPGDFKAHDIGPSAWERWGIHVGHTTVPVSEARRKLVDAALYELVRSGEWQRLYDAYFSRAQPVVGEDVQVAVGQPPTIAKPGFRE